MRYLWEESDIKAGVFFGSGANNSLDQIIKICKRGDDLGKFQVVCVATGELYGSPKTAKEMAESFNKPLNKGDDKGTNSRIYNQLEINDRFQWLQDNYYPPFERFKRDTK